MSPDCLEYRRPTAVHLCLGRLGAFNADAMNSSLAPVDIAAAAINSVSVLVCLLAVILVFALKLHKKVVYRLSLYQVLSSLFFATVETLQIIFVNYRENPESHIYGQACIFFGWLDMYTRWMKLLFTTWVTFHLFCFGVLRKNLDKLEIFYVVTSVFVPAVIAVVPLTTHTYKPSPFYAYCFIYSSNDSHQIELIESLVLWDVPAMVILLAASVAMVTMLGTIAKLLCRKSKYEALIAGDHFWKVLRHLLPLAAFPILFFICVIPSLIVHIYSMVTTSSNKALEATYLLFISMWSMASGVTLIVHLSVARCLTRKVNIALSQSQTTELHQSSHYS